jgi:translation initiation factor 2B subunit (eIF-2B alpha/beta/delta family)
MSGLDQMLRLQKFTLDEKRRQAADLDALIERLRGDVRRLDEDVAREIETARGNLELERALPDYRRVMAERRERILKSISDLSAELEKLREVIMESFSELKKTEQTILNRQQRQRLAQRRRDQVRADEVGLELHRRKKDTSL